MISIWWLFPAFIVGVEVGIVLICLCSADRIEHHKKRRWWDE